MANEIMMNNGGMEHTTYEKKYVMKESEKDCASKAVANTALGFGIGSLGLQLLNNSNNGNGLLNGILGNGNNNSMNQELFQVYKGYRDSDNAIIAMHNADLFALYNSTVQNNQVLQKEIDDMKTKLAVADAVAPYKEKMLYDAIALERERREANDCQLLNYANCTFYPQYTADITPASTSTMKTIGNPLACFQGYGNCGCR